MLGQKNPTLEAGGSVSALRQNTTETVHLTELIGLVHWKEVTESKEKLNNQLSEEEKSDRSTRLGIKKQGPEEVFPRCRCWSESTPTVCFFPLRFKFPRKRILHVSIAHHLANRKSILVNSHTKNTCKKSSEISRRLGSHHSSPNHT